MREGLSKISPETSRDLISEKLALAIGPVKAEIEATFPQLKLSKIFIKDLRFSVGEPIRSDWWAASCQDWETGRWEVRPQGESHSNRSGQSDLLNAIKEAFERLNKSRGVNVKKVSIFLRAGEEQLCAALGIEVRKQETGLCVAELDFTLAKKLKDHRCAIASTLGAFGVVVAGVAVAVSRRRENRSSGDR